MLDLGPRQPIIGPGGGGAAAGGTVTTALAVGNNGGSFTTTSAAFVDVTSATATIAAAIGDVLSVAFSCTFSQSTNAINTFFLLTTTTGGNTIDSQQYTAATLAQQYPGPMDGMYAVQAGDISGGNVAVKVRVASNGSSTLTIFNTGSVVWRLSVVNYKH